MPQLVLAAILLRGPQVAAAEKASWQREAEHIVGGGDRKMREAKKRLLRLPDLDAQLKVALNTPQRYLALDVIAALGKKSFIDDIVELSLKDTSGFPYLTLNTFIQSSNKKYFSDLYVSRLEDDQTSAASKVVLLDTLSRMHTLIDKDLVEELLFEDQSPEVRSAALSYVRHSLLTLKSDGYLYLFRRLLETEKLSLQMKIQALYLYSELPRNLSSSLSGTKNLCSVQIPKDLKKVCSGPL